MRCKREYAVVVALLALTACAPQGNQSIEAPVEKAAIEDTLPKDVQVEAPEFEPDSPEQAENEAEAEPRMLKSGAGTPVPWLNNITVGSKVESVFGFRHENACLLQVGAVDCEFTSPNGVRYIGFDTFVGTVVADANTSANVVLPYGVELGEARAETLAKLPSDLRWNDMDDVVLSIDDFEGAEGWTYRLYFTFADGLLTEVKYYAQYV